MTQPNHINETLIETNHICWFQVIAAGVLFLLSGVISAYFYSVFYHNGGPFLPGLLYTSATLLLFVICKIPISLKRMLIYCVLINLIYVAVLFATLASLWFVFITGFITASTGALLTFAVTNKFIIQFRFLRSTVIVTGAVSFLITLILNSIFDDGLVGYLFKLKESEATILTDIFIFWQPIVGATLAISLKKSLDIVASEKTQKQQAGAPGWPTTASQQ